MRGSLVLWNITARDTARTGGYGRCELRYLVGEVVAKSRVWKTWTEPAMDPDAGAYRDSGQPSVGEVSAHSRLTGRDAENQHPISAITQLANELNSRLTTSSTITALDIIKMMEE